jgi:hypothetical protein
MAHLDPKRHWSLRTDNDGRVVFPGLIPGAPYRLRIQDDIFLKAEDVDEKEKAFLVQSGRQLDLGTVVVNRP